MPTKLWAGSKVILIRPCCFYMVHVWFMYGSCMVYVWFMYENSMATVYLRHTSGMAQVCRKYGNSMRSVSNPYETLLKLSIANHFCSFNIRLRAIPFYIVFIDSITIFF